MHARRYHLASLVRRSPVDLLLYGSYLAHPASLSGNTSTALRLGNLDNHLLLNGLAVHRLGVDIVTIDLAAKLWESQHLSHDVLSRAVVKLTVSTIMPVIWYGSALEAGRRSSK